MRELDFLNKLCAAFAAVGLILPAFCVTQVGVPTSGA